MLLNMQALHAAARMGIAILATITGAAACSIFYPVLPVGPAFQVHVKDRGHPVRGLRITLTGKNDAKTAETSENGTVHFRNIPPGTYKISAEFDGGMPDAATLNVTANGPADKTIPLRWPNHTPLSVQALKGILRWPIEPHQQSILRVDLLDARTGKLQKSVQSSPSRAFNLGIPTPGLYLLRVSPIDTASDGAIRFAGTVPVEVDPKAAYPELDLEFGWTSCGVTVTPLHTCPRQDLNTTSLSGQVLDPSGASIARAAISLFNTNHEIAEQLTSDEDGRFASPKQFDGDYDLIVTSPGFTTLRQPLHAIRSNAAARPSPLRIQLGIAGACSSAATQ